MSRIFKNRQIKMTFYTMAFFALAVVFGLYLMLWRNGKDFFHTVYLFAG